MLIIENILVLYFNSFPLLEECKYVYYAAPPSLIEYDHSNSVPPSRMRVQLYIINYNNFYPR